MAGGGVKAGEKNCKNKMLCKLQKSFRGRHKVKLLDQLTP